MREPYAERAARPDVTTRDDLVLRWNVQGLRRQGLARMLDWCDGNPTARDGDVAAASNPKARVIALIHHTMLASCVLRATVERRSRKVVSDVDLSSSNGRHHKVTVL
jgi:hypothetical protein